MAECLGDARKAAGCEMCYVKKGLRAGQRECTEKRKISSRNWARRQAQNNPEARREYDRKYYELKKQKGLCVRCGRQSDGGIVCGACKFEMSLRDMGRLRIR